MELARRYPKAKQALIEIRDQEVRDCLEGSGYLEKFQEEVTLELFDRLEKVDPSLSQKCYLVIKPIWMKRGMYSRFLSYRGEPQAQLEGIQRDWEAQKRMEKSRSASNEQLAKQNPNFRLPPRIHYADTYFVSQTHDLIEILVGLNRNTEAEKIRDQALALLDDPRLKSAVEDAEKKIHK